MANKSVPAKKKSAPPNRHSASSLGIMYPEEAARELSVSLSAVYELIRTGKLKALRQARICSQTNHRDPVMR